MIPSQIRCSLTILSIWDSYLGITVNKPTICTFFQDEGVISKWTSWEYALPQVSSFVSELARIKLAVGRSFAMRTLAYVDVKTRSPQGCVT